MATYLHPLRLPASDCGSRFCSPMSFDVRWGVRRRCSRCREVFAWFGLCIRLVPSANSPHTVSLCAFWLPYCRRIRCLIARQSSRSHWFRLNCITLQTAIESAIETTEQVGDAKCAPWFTRVSHILSKSQFLIRTLNKNSLSQVCTKWYWCASKIYRHSHCQPTQCSLITIAKLSKFAKV